MLEKPKCKGIGRRCIFRPVPSSGADGLFAGWCSHYNFRNGVGVKNSPMPRLQFTERFVIVRNPDFRAPVLRELDILGTPNPKLVARKRDNLERFERVRLGQFSQLLNHSRARIESGCNFHFQCRLISIKTATPFVVPASFLVCLESMSESFSYRTHLPFDFQNCNTTVADCPVGASKQKPSDKIIKQKKSVGDRRSVCALRILPVDPGRIGRFVSRALENQLQRDQPAWHCSYGPNLARSGINGIILIFTWLKSQNPIRCRCAAPCLFVHPVLDSGAGIGRF
jgi:hypothetical protein